MQLSLLLPFVSVMCVQSNSIFFLYLIFYLFPIGDPPEFFVPNFIGTFYIHYSPLSTYLQCSLHRVWKPDTCVTHIVSVALWSFEALCLVLCRIRTR